MSRWAIAVLLFANLVLPAGLSAEHTRYWTETDFGEFEKGTADGVALRSDGKLLPAPKFSQFADPNLAFLWSLKADSRGRLYAAGGSDAKVVRIDDAGKATTVFESSELEAQALAIDSKDNLFVGTSPDGKVYKVTTDGQKTVFFDPKSKYIWALAFDPQGNLFLATGDEGNVFVVSADGKGQRFYQTHERHARSLAFDSKGSLLIGTEPDGLILRIEVNRAAAVPTAGPAFVVYETSKAEVTSLAVDQSGAVYASAVGEKPSRSESPRIQTNASSQSASNANTVSSSTIVIVQDSTPSAAPAAQTPLALGGSAVSGGRGAEVVKIAADGSPQVLWTSPQDLVYSVALSPEGKILLGTGDSGALIQLDGDSVFSRVAKTASAQVTSLVAGPDGKVYVGTANPGKIFVMGPGFQPNGSFESQVFDAKIFTHWGRLTWFGQNSTKSNDVEFYVRSGNTSDPTDNWSPWSGPYKDPSGEQITSPSSRFAQWKVVFSSPSDNAIPEISWASLAYQPVNVAPVIDDVVVEAPGIRVAGFASQGGSANLSPAQLRYPRAPGSGAAASVTSESLPLHIEVPPQGFTQKSYESVLWSAHDDNDDDLVFSVYYRAEGERNWRLLKDKITQHFYTWDSTSLPDGAYFLKVAVSDSPSNPADQALQSERESDRFEVANTPPKIENLHAAAPAASTVVSFDAVSASGAIAHAQYSIDAGDWQVVFPHGLLSDAPKESYSIALNSLAPGEHTVAVQVSDRFENSVSGELTFTVSNHAAQ